MIGLLDKLNSKYERQLEDRLVQEADVAWLSVLGFIRQLLNTRIGSVLVDRSFGMPSFNIGAGAASQHDQSQILDTIKATILRHEPRVTALEIAVQQNDQVNEVLGFRLKATLLNGTQQRASGALLADGTIRLE